MTDLYPINIDNDNGERWDERAARVAREAMRQSDARGGVAFAQSRVTWIAASLLFAAGLVLMVVSARAPVASPTAELQLVVAPADDLGRAIALRERPPEIEALMLEPPRSASP
jgi:hypothetical protein